MSLKRWIIVLIAAIVLVACGSPSVQAVARVDNISLSRQELDQRIDRVEQGLQNQPQGGQAPSRLDIERQLVDLFVNQNLVLSLAKQRGVAISDKEIDDRVNEFRQQITQAGDAKFDDVVRERLGLSGGDSSEFRQFASFSVAQEKLAATLVTSDTVKQQVTDQVMAEASKLVIKATVAHILLQVPAGADAAADAAAKAKAEQAIQRLAKGEDFAALAKELSDDPGSKDNGGVYENVTQGQMVPEFDKATFEDLQPGETTKTPIKTQFGYHVIRLMSRNEGPAMTPEQAQQTIAETIEQQLQQERGQALQQLITDEREKAKRAGRLVEPTYPEPTPAPTAPAQPSAAPNAQPPIEQPSAAPPVDQPGAAPAPTTGS